MSNAGPTGQLQVDGAVKLPIPSSGVAMPSVKPEAERGERDETEGPNFDLSRTGELARLVANRFNHAKALRVFQEQKWGKAMMNFNGEYGPDVTFRDGMSQVFINITQMKSMAAYSRLMSIMQGPAGFPWDIAPTPHPHLAMLGTKRHTMQDAAQLSPQMGGMQGMMPPQQPGMPGIPGAQPQMAQMPQQGMGMGQMPQMQPGQYHDELSEAIKQDIINANNAAEGMKNKISDYLSETHWDEKFSRFLLDFVIFGTGIIKGPMMAPPKPKKWMLVDKSQGGMRGLLGKAASIVGIKTQTQEWQLVSPDGEDDRPELEWVSPFEFYPDPAAYSIEQCMWAIHRHVMNAHEVRELAKRPDFDAEEIDAVLTQMPKGNWHAEPWESRVDIVNRRNSAMARGDRFVVLEMWGFISGRELALAGQEIEDEDLNRDHMCCIWAIGNHCIKVAKSAMQDQRLPFFVASYEKIPYSIWGRGVPEKMADPQDILNAATRAMIDNMGISAGPQVVVDTSRLVDGTKIEQIQPWGIWPIKNMEGMSRDPVQFVNVPSNLSELKVVQDIYRNFIQEVTSLPDMTSGIGGQGQHNRTSSGMSMLFNAADTYTRGVVFNIDNQLTKPMIRRLYDFAMQFSQDQSIKGDFEVEAKGVQGLLANEQVANTLTQLGPMFSSEDFAPWINKPELVKEMLRNLKIYNTSIVYSEEEALQKMQQIAQMKTQQAGQIAQAQEAAKPRAETTPKDAILQILGDVAKDPNSEDILPDLLEKALDAFGFLDQETEQTIQQMKEHRDNRMVMKAQALDQHGTEGMIDDRQRREQMAIDRQKSQMQVQAALQKMQSATQGAE